MRRASGKAHQYSHNHHSKKSKRKQFLVDPNRLELDQYMLKQIKNNKKSVKHLNRQVSTLKKEVKKLQQQHDDYMIADRTKTQDHSQSHVTQKNLVKNRISLTEQQSSRKCASRPKDSSKESSLLSISSSRNSSRINSLSSSKKSKNTAVPTSKQRLSRKIEQLKAKAGLHPRQKDLLKKQVKQKIQKMSEKIDGKIETQFKKCPKVLESKEREYQRLLQLLQTNMAIKAPQSPHSQQSPRKIYSPKKNERKQLNLIPVSQTNSIPQKNVDLEVHFQKRESADAKTLQSTGNTPFRSSQHFPESSAFTSRPQDYNVCNQTNLLDSPTKSIKSTTKSGNKQLRMSRCVEIKITNQVQAPSSGSEGSGIYGIFGSPAEMKSGPVQMSFQEKDQDKRRLRELQFQFDQLVRQQLISSDPKQKQVLAQAIRSVLWSISQLKGKIGNNNR